MCSGSARSSTTSPRRRSTGVKIGVGLTVAAGQLPKLLGIPGDPSADNFFASCGPCSTSSTRSAWRRRSSRPARSSSCSGSGGSPRGPRPAGGGRRRHRARGRVARRARHRADRRTCPSGLPTPVAPYFDHVKELLPGAFAIAIMVFLETVSVARSVRRRVRAADRQRRRSCSPPACPARSARSSGRCRRPAGSRRRRSTSDAGARTQLSELVTVVLAVACALFLGSVLSDLPQATLGCMVVVAVLGLIKPAELARFWRLSRRRVLGRGHYGGVRPDLRDVAGGAGRRHADAGAGADRARPRRADRAPADAGELDVLAGRRAHRTRSRADHPAGRRAAVHGQRPFDEPQARSPPRMPDRTPRWSCWI